MAQATVSTINFGMNQTLTAMSGRKYETRIFGVYNPEDSLTILHYEGFSNFKDLQVPCWVPEDHLYGQVTVEVMRKFGTKLRINDT